MQTCATCEFFMLQTEEQGLCRRFPPVPLVFEGNQTISVFPPMLNEGYCGEHQGVENETRTNCK